MYFSRREKRLENVVVVVLCLVIYQVVFSNVSYTKLLFVSDFEAICAVVEESV